MITLASIHIHPVKSLGGFSVAETRLTPRGPEHDRRWMLVDENNRFISQREHATMACLHCAPSEDGFCVTDVRTNEKIELPWEIDHGRSINSNVWNDRVEVVEAPAAWSTWFCERVGPGLRLTYMPEESIRPTDASYAVGETSLSDGYPYLIISQSSLDDLNARIKPHNELAMDRFRPNLVIAGGDAYQEDDRKEITIGAARFALVKKCSRCVIPTTDQWTGARTAEPLRTLAMYRKRVAVDGVVKVDFGMNAMCMNGGSVRVGDLVKL